MCDEMEICNLANKVATIACVLRFDAIAHGSICNIHMVITRLIGSLPSLVQLLNEIHVSGAGKK